jgi:threonyl-tRNA synthetase
LAKKVRNAEKQHINYIVVVWEKEQNSNTLAVRNYKTKEQTQEDVNEFIERIKQEIQTKAL